MPMTMSELLSWVRMSCPEEKPELVEQFLLELQEAGVKILNEGRSGNHYRLEHGREGVKVSLNGSTDWGWWGVTENYVNKVAGLGGDWGVVFLTSKEHFWVDGRNFMTIVRGDLDENKKYHVHQPDLEKSPSSANRFSSVREFLSISGLSELR